MPSTLFPNTKSPVQINTLTKLLKEIAAAGPAGISKPKVDVDKLVAANPVLIEGAQVDAHGNQIVRLSAAGTEALANHTAAPTTSSTGRTPIKFELQTGFVPATPNRSGLRSSIYPFGSMEDGQSFFVPATAEQPDPAKSLASTVSAATRRYATVVDGQFKPGRKNGNQIPVRNNTKEFTIRAVEENGVKGARIYRTK